MNNLTFDRSEYLIYGFESKGAHIIPPHFQNDNFSGDTLLWLMPVDGRKSARKIECESYEISKDESTVTVSFSGKYSEKLFPSYPCCDFFGNEIELDIEGGKTFEKALAMFYWKNLLNEIAERNSMKIKDSIREGYVLSTLDTDVYAGTYPAVDHEFHMKGRFAFGSEVEAELIKRMLLLQIKIMREDRKGIYRNVCSIQPNGKREYNVQRRSQNRRVRAQMFRITANVEFVEGMYNYYCLTKDVDFVREHIADLEKNCSYIERFIDGNGFLNSHVYFEDQVIKNYSVLQAQLFAANSFMLMSKIERLLDRDEQAKHYAQVGESLGRKAVQSYPDGFWDSENKRFIDWIDKKGRKHDRIHLLANELPELFGFASEEQAELCRKAVNENSEVFSKFPSFVAAKTGEYTADEIGSGGPYDLCAAGRYWCWDAEYLTYRKDGEKLFEQLMQVAKEAENSSYLMGERYDMNYVYYNTGKDAERNWHGAARYYEYPNVFIYVLIADYLGVRRGFDCDFTVNPLFKNGRVKLGQLGLEFTVKDGKVSILKNNDRLT